MCFVVFIRCLQTQSDFNIMCVVESHRAYILERTMSSEKAKGEAMNAIQADQVLKQAGPGRGIPECFIG